MLPIYIINLESAKERARFISQQLDALGLDYTFFPAVNGRENPDHYLFKHYNQKKHFNRKGRKLSLGELGCFASHYLLWEKCVADNEPIIILEDDINILDNFIHFYSQSAHLADKYGFLWLHKNYRGGKYCVIDKYSEQFNVIKYDREYMGTLGYVITPAIAKVFLLDFAELIYPLDDQMARFYRHKSITNFALYPCCVDREETIDSIIGTKFEKGKLSIVAKIKREYFNTLDYIKRNLFNFNFKRQLKRQNK